MLTCEDIRLKTSRHKRTKTRPSKTLQMNFALVILLFTLASSFGASVIPKVLSSKDNPELKIIGGNTARAAQFPYAAAIYTSTQNSRHFCTGTVLSNEWVLTAAQCVEDAISFDIRLGSIHLDNADGSQVEVATSTHIQHPDFNPDTLENDIGLIKLRSALTFTTYLKAIDRLPLSEVPDFINVATYGWGQTSDANADFANDLQWAPVTTLTNEECALVYGNQIKETMVCAVGNYNQGTCYGDIGSSLIQYYSTGHAIPVGISSFVSYNGCESSDPSGFTRVYPYNDWIRNATGLNI